MILHAEPLRAAGAVRHGFFTREGGVSEGPFASLNCGLGSGDDPQRVAGNRARAMARLDLDGEALITAYQCHSADCVTVTEPWERGAAPKADAMVSHRPGVALGILTADCAPVLFADASAGVIGAAHAGWRGALGGVLEATVAAMAALGAARERTVAALGPCIGPQCYEVGPEFFAAFRDADAANAALFTASARDGHYMFDLPGYVMRRLSGLGLAGVALLAHDTCADAERFFSYRRACHAGERDYGRLLSAIALAE
ncbi:MAG: peptidoglycan editing factor PgeF [Alphaproteobacteria bacterium]